MKIAIVSVGDYRHISMISKYTEYFDSHHVEYDILCTDRYEGTVYPSSIIKAFPCKNLKTKREKLGMFLSFYRWASRIIKQEKYDFLVIWNENTAPLFAPLLLTKYRHRYCVNIRDVDFLNQKAVNIVRERVIRNSAFSTYCSTAKLDFPKGYPYVLMRSINMKILQDTTPRTGFRKPGEKIRIVNIGKIRFPMANKRIIEALGNDDRFELLFIGAGSEKLESYKEKYNNITLIGAYLPEETASYLETARDIALYHHEKWDGSGYPKGLKGEEIPLCARIMAVADVFDALVSERVYKKAFSFEKAMEIIQEESGTHFDPRIVKAFVAAEDEVRQTAEKFLDK